MDHNELRRKTTVELIELVGDITAELNIRRHYRLLDFSHLSRSHFDSAYDWDDRSACLKWANENEATVAEMHAWRRAQRGEDLTMPEGQ